HRIATLSTPASLRFLCSQPDAPAVLHSFPTRRSSDLSTTSAVESGSISAPPLVQRPRQLVGVPDRRSTRPLLPDLANRRTPGSRSEEHTSELQSRENLVCRLLLEKKKKERKGATQTCA